ncbi:MAG: acetate--CoA ligase family protein [Halobacteriales archaeon]
MVTPPDLEALFAPKSVAVVGASPDSWYSAQLMDNLLDYGFTGTVYPVNPSRDRAWDRRCYDSITDLPETVDLAVVSVPREYVIDVVEAAAGMGVPAALVITAGFAEADATGEELQTELASVAERENIHVCGPNCIGLANSHAETVLTSTCSRKPTPGPIALASQSGALAFTTFFERGADTATHFSHIVSTGNEADLTMADYVAYLGAQPTVDVICLYLEGLPGPRHFADVAREVTANGTPILTVKVGRSEVGEAAAQSHTGSLTGDEDRWEAVFRHAGIQRVADIPDLLGHGRAHAALDPPSSARTCVLSTSGGLASLLGDLGSEHGLEFPALSESTEDTLLDMEELLTFGELNNPIDIRGYGADVLPEIAETVFDDPTFDAYIIAVALSAVDERAAEIADNLRTVADMADDPVLFLWTGRRTPADQPDPQPYEQVQSIGPLYADPERCIEALASLVAFDADRSRIRAGDPTIPEPETTSDLPTGTTLTWTEAESLLARHDIDPIRTRIVETARDAVQAVAGIDGPAVMKIDARGIHHRAEIGGVELAVTAETAREAFDRITDNAAAADPDADAYRVLVQPQIDEGIEAIVGGTRTDAFGPTITVGTGGTHVETIDDSEVRLAPLSRHDARDAIEATRLAERLSSSNMESLADLLVRVGDLLAGDPGIAELDCNPVIMTPEDGPRIVDVLVTTA